MKRYKIILFVFVAIFVGVSQCQTSVKNKIESGKQNRYNDKSFAILRAQNSQVMIWALDIMEKREENVLPTVVGLGVIVDDLVVIASSHIFDKFLKKPFVFLAVRSDFYWAGIADNNENMVSLIKKIEPRGDIAAIIIVDENDFFTMMRGTSPIMSKFYEARDEIFILGDRNNAEALEKINGEVVAHTREDFIVELFVGNSAMIDRQIALGATVWDAKGNFIGFLAERIDATNRARLIVSK